MCTVSMVMEQWQNPASPNFIPWPQIDYTTASKMLEILNKLEQLDKKLGKMEQCLFDLKAKKAYKQKLKKIAAKKLK